MLAAHCVKKLSGTLLEGYEKAVALHPGKFPAELQHSFQSFGVVGFRVNP